MRTNRQVNHSRRLLALLREVGGRVKGDWLRRSDRPALPKRFAATVPVPFHADRREVVLAPGYLFLLTALAVGLIGCNNYQPTPEPAPRPAAKSPPAETKPAPVQPSLVMVKKKAAVGVGKKGHYGKGIIATPLGSLFAAEERIDFEVQIPHAMQMFKALNGRAPKDTEEFMEKIIKEYRIRLPELPEGQRYEYDPKTEQLMVLVPEEE